MADKWFISDTHFYHANILKFVGRDGRRVRPEFDNVGQMNDAICSRWNARVKPQDKVYHLGDVTFRYHDGFRKMMRSLHGHKRLILGNHDKLSRELYDCFEKVSLWAGFKEGNFTCSHIPLRLDSLRDGAFNVHGHIHERTMVDHRYINVCVEQTNYTPLHYDEILAKIKERTDALRI